MHEIINTFKFLICGYHLIYMKKIKLFLLMATLSLTSTLSTSSVAMAEYKLVPKLPMQIEDGEVSSIPSPNNVLRTLGRASENILQRDLNIVVWNLYKGKNATFTKEFLKITEDADLIISQEMFLDYSMNKTLLSKDQYFYQTATSFFSGKNDVRTGLITGSKVAPLSAKYIRTINTEPFAKTPKLTMLTTYDVEGIDRPLMVANIHGINFVTHDVFSIEINRIFKVLKNHKGPMIFAGDFNTWSVERLKTLNRLASSIGLKPTVFFPDNRTTFNGNKLDQFYHTNDIHVTSAKAISEFQGSDHTPLLVNVHILYSSGQ